MSSKILTLSILVALSLWALPGRGAAAVLQSTSGNAGKVYLTMDQALKLAFPGCKVERTTAYLTVPQQKSIEKASKSVFKSRVVFPYVATKDGKVIGTAYFDTHKVRSLRETLMVVVTPKGTIKRVELLSFAEPRQYRAKPKWLNQMVSHKLSDDLRLGGKIRSMGGATLTAKASVDCARRILALHASLEKAKVKVPAPKPKPTPKPKPAPKPAKKPAKKPA